MGLKLLRRAAGRTRLLVAFDAELFGTILRIFVDEVTRHHVRRALALGLTD